MNSSKANLTINDLLTYLVVFGLLSSITLPAIHIGPLSLYLVTLISPVVLFFVITLFSMRGDRYFKINAVVIYPFLLGLMVVISSLRSWGLGLSLTHVGDFIEAVKYLQFIPYLMSLHFIVKDNVLSIIRALLFFSGILIIIIGYVQYFQIPFINEYLTLLYLSSDSVHLATALSGNRITITGSDPNVGAVICYFFGLYFLIYSLSEKKIFYFILFLLCAFLGFMTQSRTAMIAFFLAISIHIVFMSNMKILLKLTLVSVLAISSFYIIFLLDLQYITLGYEYALEGDNNSLNVRFDNLSIALERFNRSPIFGYGPAKSEFSTIVDSEYALILQRYGSIGILVFSSYFIYLFRLSRSCISSIWSSCLTAFLVVSIVVMATNNIFSGYQLMSIVILLNIACIFSAKEKRNTRPLAKVAEDFTITNTFTTG